VYFNLVNLKKKKLQHWQSKTRIQLIIRTKHYFEHEANILCIKICQQHEMFQDLNSEQRHARLYVKTYTVTFRPKL